MNNRSAKRNGNESARIDRDLECRSCGYNLRGLDPSGTCPECSLAVEISSRKRTTCAGWTGVFLCMIPLIVAGLTVSNAYAFGIIGMVYMPTRQTIEFYLLSWSVATIAWILFLIRLKFLDRLWSLFWIITSVAVVISVSALFFNAITWVIYKESGL